MPWQNYLLGWSLRLPLLLVLVWVSAFSQSVCAQTPAATLCDNFAKGSNPANSGQTAFYSSSNVLLGVQSSYECRIRYADGNLSGPLNYFHEVQCDSTAKTIVKTPGPDQCECVAPTVLKAAAGGKYYCGGCPSGKESFHGQCMDVCPLGTRRNEVTGACMCSQEGQVIIDGVCKTPDVCPQGDYSGSGYDGDCGHAPDNCPEGDLSGSSTDGSCDCPAGKEKVGSSCQDPCPNGKHRNQETGACDDNCTNGMVWNGSACGCPEGSYYGQVNGQDSCIAGSGNDGSGSGSGDTSGGSSGSGDGGTSSGGSGGTGSSGSGDSGGSSSGGDTSGGTGSSGTGSGGSGSGTGSGTGTGTGTGTDSGTGSGTGTGTGTNGSTTCASGLTKPDGTCFVADTSPDLSGITSRLDTLINKIPSSLPSKTTGSFPTTSDDAQIAALKSDIYAQFALIKTSIGQMFAASTITGAGSLPCYRNLPLFAGKTFSICFSDYEDELAIIPLFIYGMGFILAVSIVLGGKKND